MTTAMEYHNPVLLHETVDGLNIKPDGIYVDVTFGGGGHSKEILRRLDPMVSYSVLIKMKMLGTMLCRMSDLPWCRRISDTSSGF